MATATLPTLSEYQAALQSPQVSFTDPDLRGAKAEATPLGLPRPRSGGFALTYHMSAGAREWAVRCFHKHSANRNANYRAISQFLNAKRYPFAVEFEYQENGIRVGGRPHPIVKMAWVEGRTLGDFVDGNFQNSAMIDRMAEEFRSVVSRLEADGVAHGDLQHGNIMVSRGKMLLVDYDGMFVPGMQPQAVSEMGHVNYQHPLRNNTHFGSYLDRFASVAIYLGLKAVVADAALWRKYSTGENILFQRDDLYDPSSSRLFSDLSGMAAVSTLAGHLVSLTGIPVEKLPTLEDVIAGRVPQVTRVAPVQQPAARRFQHDVVEATLRDELLRREGDVLIVTGVVKDVHSAMKFGRPYAILNFGDWRQGCFSVPIWGKMLEELRNAGIEPRNLKGKRINVVGLVERYDSKRGTSSPQIEPEQVAALDVNCLLTRPGATVSRVPGAGRTNADVLKELEGGKPPKGGRKSPPMPVAPPPSHPPPPPTPPRSRNQDLIHQLEQRYPTATPTTLALSGGQQPSAAPATPQAAPPAAPPAGKGCAPEYIGAAIGAVIGGFVAPGIGIFVGALIGWWAIKPFK